MFEQKTKQTIIIITKITYYENRELTQVIIIMGSVKKIKKSNKMVVTKNGELRMVKGGGVARGDSLAIITPPGMIGVGGKSKWDKTTLPDAIDL